MEQRLSKVERDVDKLWNEHKHYAEISAGLKQDVRVIHDKLYAMSQTETVKAVERQKMMDTLCNVDDNLETLNGKFEDHVVDEMAAYDKMRKVVGVIGAVLVAVVVDNQAGTHLVSSIWAWAIHTVTGM